MTRGRKPATRPEMAYRTTVETHSLNFTHLKALGALVEAKVFAAREHREGCIVPLSAQLDRRRSQIVQVYSLATARRVIPVKLCTISVLQVVTRPRSLAAPRVFRMPSPCGRFWLWA